MNPFTVVWEQDALNATAQLWIESSNRAAITAACTALDKLLSKDPLMQGKPLHEELRKIEVAQLVTLFSVEEQDCLVVVKAVKLA
jgi:hypothetical protein